MNIPKKWLHIQSELQYHDFNVHKIYSAMQQAELKRTALLDHYGLSISGGLTIILAIFAKLVSIEKEIYKQKPISDINEDSVYNDQKKGYGISIEIDLKNSFIIYIDSLLFELESTWELIKKFITEFYSIKNKKLNSEEIKNLIMTILNQKKSGETWYSLLDVNRNHFAHKSKPYFSIDISSDDYDILVMKKNIQKFNNKNEFIRLSEIKKMYADYFHSLTLITDHFIQEANSKE